ncbi:hypothetical protein ACFCVO_08445 [Agromyces sp. NPDC056379]|uniref:hypothetical protein n=1 Tax=unclassified Agromyces TaxID=2639701 RepID=UPI0035D5F8D5
MPETLDRPHSAAQSVLPGAAILRRTRSLLFCALGTGLAYSVLGNASKGGCPGGVTGGGGFIDAGGQPTDVAPNCINVTLQPSGIVFLAIAVIVLVAITRVLKSSATEAAALRTLDRAALVIVAVTATWLVITHVSFWMIPLDQWDGGGYFPIPFTFGAVDIDISPMQQG